MVLIFIHVIADKVHAPLCDSLFKSQYPQRDRHLHAPVFVCDVGVTVPLYHYRR